MFEIRRTAFDKRHPEPNKNYGIGSVELGWYVKGEAGVIQFTLITGWHLKRVADELIRRCDGPNGQFPHCSLQPLPSDIGYHSPVPLYDGQTVLTDECPFLDGRPCYYDGSSSMADGVFKVLVEQGEDALWAALEEWYADRFSEVIAAKDLT